MYAHASLQEDHENRTRVLEAPGESRPMARLVDSTLLKPDATLTAVERLCREAAAHGFRAVCVPPCYVSQARAVLDSADAAHAVALDSVAGFANGYTTTEAKVFEARDAVRRGADEIDFVQNDTWVKDCNWPALDVEYRAMVDAVEGRLVKIILETSLLTEAEISECARRAALAGVHVIKTSTGLGARGVTPRDIEIVAAILDECSERTGLRYGIKASGGIRTADHALELVRLGATRLGTSSGPAIVARP